MNYVMQFLIIISFTFAGELLHALLPLPIPASIYGIVLLFAALELKWVKVRQIREVSSFLIAVMPIMFIPAAVGLMDSWGLIKAHWLSYVALIVVTTVVVMGASGYATQLFIQRRKRLSEKGGRL